MIIFLVIITNVSNSNQSKLYNNQNPKTSDSIDIYSRYLLPDTFNSIYDDYSMILTDGTADNNYRTTLENKEIPFFPDDNPYSNLPRLEGASTERSKYRTTQTYFDNINELAYRTNDTYDYSESNRNIASIDNILKVNSDTTISEYYNGSMEYSDNDYKEILFDVAEQDSESYYFTDELGLQNLEIDFVDELTLYPNDLIEIKYEGVESMSIQKYQSAQYSFMNHSLDYSYYNHHHYDLLYITGTPYLYILTKGYFLRFNNQEIYAHHTGDWHKIGNYLETTSYTFDIILDYDDETTLMYLDGEVLNSGNPIPFDAVYGIYGKIQYQIYKGAGGYAYIYLDGIVFTNVYNDEITIESNVYDINLHESEIFNTYLNLTSTQDLELTLTLYNTIYTEYDNFYFNLIANTSYFFTVELFRYFYEIENKIYYNISFTINKTVYLMIDEFQAIISIKDYEGSIASAHLYYSYNTSVIVDYTSLFSIYFFIWNDNISNTIIYTRITHSFKAEISFSYSKEYYFYPESNITTLSLESNLFYGISSIYPNGLNYTNILIDIRYTDENFIEYNQTILESFSDHIIHNDIDYYYPNGQFFTLYFSNMPNFDAYYKSKGYYKNALNYVYNTLKYIRLLQCNNSYNYTRFFDIPYILDTIEMFDFNQPIDVYDPLPPEMASREMTALTEKYWTYTVFRIEPDIPYNTTVGNWSIEFTPIKVCSYEARFYYYDEAIVNDNTGIFYLGVALVNFFILFIQLVGYFIIAVVSFVFSLVFSYILFFLWNVCVYWIYIGLCWVLWWIILLGLLILEGLLWLWSNVLLPFLEWFWYNVVPLIVDLIIKGIAMVIALLVYMITFGQADLLETYHMVYELLWLIVIFLYDLFLVFLENIVFIILGIVWYVLCAGMLYFRYIYSRARGFIKKAEKQYYTFLIYIAPIVFVYNILKSILEAIPTESV